MEQRREDAFRSEVSRRGLTRYFAIIAEETSRRAAASTSGANGANTMTAAERMAALRRRVTRRIEDRASHTVPVAAAAATEDTNMDGRIGDPRAAEPETGDAVPEEREERRNELHKIHQNGMRIHKAPAQCDRSLTREGVAEGHNGSAMNSGAGDHYRKAAGATARANPIVSSAETAAASQVAWHTGAAAVDGA